MLLSAQLCAVGGFPYALLVHPVKQVVSVGEPATLRTSPGSRPPMVKPVVVGCPEPAGTDSVLPEIVALTSEAPVIEAAVKNSVVCTPFAGSAQNVGAEHQVVAEPLPTPTVCVCTILPSVNSVASTPSCSPFTIPTGQPKALASPCSKLPIPSAM